MTSEFLADFIAGWIGGLLCVLTGYPFDTVKVRQQNFSTSFLVAVRETFKYEGFFGFYKGMSSPLIMYGPSNSVFFGTCGACLKIINGRDPSEQNRPTLMQYFIAGSVGGFFQAGVMCPVELVKIALQTSTDGGSPWVHNTNEIKYESTLHAYKTITRYKGYRGLYKGFVPMFIRDVPTSGIYLVVYKGMIPNDKKKVKWYHEVCAGGCAGIASIVPILPADVIKTRIQADDLLHPMYNGMIDCAKKIYEEEGFRIFWKGLPVITLRAFPAHAMLFIGYNATMEFLR